MRPVKLNYPDVKVLIGSHLNAEDMNVIVSHGTIFSAWRPSAEELAALNDGKPVWLGVRGLNHPPVILDVGDRTDVIPPDTARLTEKAEQLLKTSRPAPAGSGKAADEALCPISPFEALRQANAALAKKQARARRLRQLLRLTMYAFVFGAISLAVAKGFYKVLRARAEKPYSIGAPR
jgi:hypothetical protein